MTDKNTDLLKLVLRGNGTFSFISGILIMSFSSLLRQSFGLQNNIVPIVIGFVLVIFGNQLVIGSYFESKLDLLTLYAVLSDFLWIVGSIIVALTIPNIDLIGLTLIALTGTVVFLLMILQGYYIARKTSLVSASHMYNAPSDIVWRVIADVRNYHKYASTISNVKIEQGDGEGMVRRCWDNRHQSWAEVCTKWEEGERYSMEVDTSDYPYPFTKFAGTWSLSSVTDDETKVAVTFEFRPKYGILGKIVILPAVRAGMKTIDQMFSNWEKEILEVLDQNNMTPLLNQ